jgi:hypothetical protein
MRAGLHFPPDNPTIAAQPAQNWLQNPSCRSCAEYLLAISERPVSDASSRPACRTDLVGGVQELRRRPQAVVGHLCEECAQHIHRLPSFPHAYRPGWPTPILAGCRAMTGT